MFSMKNRLEIEASGYMTLPRVFAGFIGSIFFFFFFFYYLEPPPGEWLPAASPHDLFEGKKNLKNVRDFWGEKNFFLVGNIYGTICITSLPPLVDIFACIDCKYTHLTTALGCRPWKSSQQKLHLPESKGNNIGDSFKPKTVSSRSVKVLTIFVCH